MRTNFYVDGFNLYYGCLKRSPYRWLDLFALCQNLMPKHEVHRVRYFSALISDRPSDPGQSARQQAYLRALERNPKVSVHLGHYLSHTIMMPVASPVEGSPAFVKVIKTEEKGSDVNIASYLLLDGFKKDYEQAVVISNDSDLKTPIELVRKELGLPVGVVFPTLNSGRQPSQTLVSVATFIREIRKNTLRDSQFPPVIEGQIHKPAEW